MDASPTRGLLSCRILLPETGVLLLEPGLTSESSPSDDNRALERRWAEGRGLASFRVMATRPSRDGVQPDLPPKERSGTGQLGHPTDHLICEGRLKLRRLPWVPPTGRGSNTDLCEPHSSHRRMWAYSFRLICLICSLRFVCESKAIRFASAL